MDRQLLTDEIIRFGSKTENNLVYIKADCSKRKLKEVKSEKANNLMDKDLWSPFFEHGGSIAESRNYAHVYNHNVSFATNYLELSRKYRRFDYFYFDKMHKISVHEDYRHAMRLYPVAQQMPYESVVIKMIDDDAIWQCFTIVEVFYKSKMKTPVIYKALDKRTNKNCVIKAIYKRQITENAEYYELWKKMCITIMAECPYIVKLYCIIESQSYVYLVMEELTGGNLYDFHKRNNHISEYECRIIIQQILLATAYLHRCGIIHRDIKLENVVFKSKHSYEIAIVDLDTCIPMSYLHRYGNNLVGTHGYFSPEVLVYKFYSYQSDLWSIGVTLYSLLTGHHPVRRNVNHIDYQTKVMSTQIGPINFDVYPLNKYDKARDMCSKLLKFDLSQRIKSATEALCHPWVNEDLKCSRICNPLRCVYFPVPICPIIYKLFPLTHLVKANKQIEMEN